MTVTELVAAGRWCNLVLVIVDLGTLFWSVRGWRMRSPGNRFHWSGLALLLFSIGYGAVESLRQGAAGGSRIALTGVALVYILCGLISKGRGRWTEDLAERARRKGTTL